jgi:hypothetical protein
MIKLMIDNIDIMYSNWQIISWLIQQLKLYSPTPKIILPYLIDLKVDRLLLQRE